jgi:hypothetical protein
MPAVTPPPRSPIELRFSCVAGCTRCCEVEGFVYFTEEDLRRAARHVGLSPAGFERRYIYRTRHLLRLRKPRHAQCHFLQPGGCALHPDKPTQCRLYPFWPELVENRRAWREAGRLCPGIGMGHLVQIGTALGTADGMRLAYPAHYKSR